MATYGEQLILKLLQSLPKPKEYFWKAETTIVNSRPSSHSNPDFVIVNMWMGVIVLEVKDWVHIRKASQDEVVIERRDGTIMSQNNPVNIAKEYTFNLIHNFEKREELHQKQGKHAGKLNFPWRYAVAMPNIKRAVIQKIEDAGVWKPGTVLSREDLTPANFEKALWNIPGAWKLTQPLNNAILDVIRGVLDPRVVITDASGQDTGTVTIPQQSLITEALPPVPDKPATLPGLSQDDLPPEAASLVQSQTIRLVRGVAGSGKSLVLVQRAQHLAEQYPDRRILVLAFNTDLTDDLKQRIPASPNVEVTNFHKVCSRILGSQWRSPNDTQNLMGWLRHDAQALIDQLQLPVEFVAAEIEYRKEMEVFDNEQYLQVERRGRGQALTKAKREIVNQIFSRYRQYQQDRGWIDWADVPYLALAALQPTHPLWHSYDVILIDEAQDFAPSWVKVIKTLLKPNGALFMCDDPTQSIFRFYSWRQKGVDVQGQTRILRVPFRNTQAISEAAHALIAADNLLSQTGDVTSPNLTSYPLLPGCKPLLNDCHNLEREIRFVEQQALSLVKAGTPAHNIAILCHDKRLTEYWGNLRQQGCYVESFWKMKGLEFQAVLIPHLHTVVDQGSLPPDEPTISEIRRRVFTAMTRARHTLILSYEGQFPEALAPIEPYVEKAAL
ncbi:MAG: DEAD/DEAH box helicase [Anaerolineae bacterium]|nr:DEAD/DEAH box helicase [Anaerolineae bacterium]